MDRLVKKDQYGRCYIVERELGLSDREVNPIRTWIANWEERAYGKPIDRLEQLEEEKDLLEKKLGCSLETAVEILLDLKSHMRIEKDMYDDGDECEIYEYVDFNGEGMNFKTPELEQKVMNWIREGYKNDQGGERR